MVLNSKNQNAKFLTKENSVFLIGQEDLHFQDVVALPSIVEAFFILREREPNIDGKL